MTSTRTHFATTYYLPSWQGGDVIRPLCHKGRPGHGFGHTASDRAEVNCTACLTLLDGQPLPAPPARKRVYRPYVPVPPKPRPIAPLVLPPPVSRGPTMPEIARTVALERGLSLDELRSDSRVKPIAHARQEAMWMMRKAGRTTIQVGRFFGRDHSTVSTGARRHEARLAEQGEGAA